MFPFMQHLNRYLQTNSEWRLSSYDHLLSFLKNFLVKDPCMERVGRYGTDPERAGCSGMDEEGL